MNTSKPLPPLPTTVALIGDPALETQLMGILLAVPAVHTTVLPLLSTDDFTDPDYQLALACMQRLQVKKIQCDYMAVYQEAKKMGKSISMTKLTKTTDRVVSGANAEAFALQLVEYRLRRQGSVLCQTHYRRFLDDSVNVLDTMERIPKDFKDLLKNVGTSQIQHISKVYENYISTLDSEEIVDGLVCAYSLPTMNHLMIGMLEGNNTVIAARPGAGKTTLMMQEIWFASQTIPVGVISLEMTSQELMYRTMSSITGIPLRNIIQRSKLDAEAKQLLRSIKDHFTKRIFIIDNIKNLYDVNVSVTKMVEQHGVRMYALDYIQLVKNDSKYAKNRNDIVTEISGELKHISKQHRIHGIILSQLSRESDKGKEEVRRPKLSDLRDSGAIEQDATSVVFIYRPEAQGVTKASDGTDLRGKAELIIAKSRNGQLGNVKITFNGAKFQFEEDESTQTSLDFIEEQNPF